MVMMLATDGDDEFGSGGEPDFTNRHDVVFGRDLQVVL